MTAEIIGIGHAMVDIFYFLPATEMLHSAIIECQAVHISPDEMDDIIDSFTKRGFVAGTPYYAQSAGGTAANILKAAALCGSSVHFIGTTGSVLRKGEYVRDDNALFFQRTLARCGVDAQIASGKGHTGRCLIVYREKEGRSSQSIVASPSIAREITPSQINPLAAYIAQGCKAVVIEGMLLQNPAVFEKITSLCGENGIILALDIASTFIAKKVAQVLHTVSSRVRLIVFANEDEASFCAEAFIPFIDRAYTNEFPIIVKKQGKHGSSAWTQGTEYSAAVPEAQQVQNPRDVIGAGDFFAGAFLTEYLSQGEKKDISLCLQKGNALASRVLHMAGTDILSADMAGTNL